MSIEFLAFSSLANIPGLHHVVTTRHGGVSVDAYSSLNLGYHVGDDAEAVTENRRLIAQAAGYDAETLIAAQQAHGNNVQVVDTSQRGRGAFDWESAIADTDALIVQAAETPAIILVADCAPVLIVDPVQRTLAAVHAGWRGAVAGVAAEAIRAMEREFQSKPVELKAGIGPCLCVACLEVGNEVAAQVSGEVLVAGYDKPHLNLRRLIEINLLDAGIPRASIETMPHCPRCRPETFFSHRGQQGKAGRFGLIAWWE